MHFKYLLIALLLLMSCQNTNVNIQRGIFEVEPPPVLNTSRIQSENGTFIRVNYQHEFGALDTYELSGVMNKKVTTYEGGELPNEPALISYSINSESEHVSLSITTAKDLSKSKDNSKLLYGGIDIGILPYPYIEEHTGFRIDPVEIGASIYLGLSLDKASYSGQYVYDENSIDGTAVLGNFNTISRNMLHFCAGGGLYSSVNLKHLSLGYYGGVYFPWISDKLDTPIDGKYHSYPISFEFPYIVQNNISVNYSVSKKLQYTLGISTMTSKSMTELIMNKNAGISYKF